jgi:hypothetical protein
MPTLTAYLKGLLVLVAVNVLAMGAMFNMSASATNAFYPQFQNVAWWTLAVYVIIPLIVAALLALALAIGCILSCIPSKKRSVR